jgi:hypothetical protein
VVPRDPWPYCSLSRQSIETRGGSAARWHQKAGSLISAESFTIRSIGGPRNDCQVAQYFLGRSLPYGRYSEHQKSAPTGRLADAWLFRRVPSYPPRGSNFRRTTAQDVNMSNLGGFIQCTPCPSRPSTSAICILSSRRAASTGLFVVCMSICVLLRDPHIAVCLGSVHRSPCLD